MSVAAGDLAGGKRYYEQGLTIRRKLAEADDTNAGLQRDLSGSFNNLGKVSVAEGDLAGAKRYFEQGLTIARKLAEADDTNAEWQRDLSISFDRLGNVSVAAVDLAGAKRYFEQGLTIRSKLAEADDTNAQMQRDLYVSYLRIADIMEKENDPEATDNWRQAHDIMASMVQRGLHVTPQDLSILDWLRKKLGDQKP